ncbi:MAG: hypothetical protein HWN68_16700 [Desulfobacterales bacterium]|nr:hypothetical protein [Desulfobacterales bacterium]
MGIIFDRQAYTLAHTYGFAPVDDLKYEPWYIAETDERYFVLASYTIPTNVLVKFHADDIEYEE